MYFVNEAATSRVTCTALYQPKCILSLQESNSDGGLIGGAVVAMLVVVVMVVGMIVVVLVIFRQKRGYAKIKRRHSRKCSTLSNPLYAGILTYSSVSMLRYVSSCFVRRRSIGIV